jgi:tetratricopeptide (TPR) repeat protein
MPAYLTFLSFTSIFFIDGSSKPRIHADMLHNVRALGTQQSQMTFKECLSFLAQHCPGHPRLIVYDNVDDPELKLLPLLPLGDHCAIIITSRNRALGQLNRQGHLELDVMSKEEAVELLLHPLNSAASPTEQALKGASAVAEQLGYLPIALTQARSYMFQTKCSASAYLERLVGSRDRLLTQPVEHQRDMRYASTYATFGASFQVLPRPPQKLLRLLSFFHWTKFPLELVSVAAKHGFSSYRIQYVPHGNEFYMGKELLEDIFHRQGKFDVTDLDQMTISLQNFSLVTLSSGVDTNLVQMHPLIHGWVNSCIPEQDRAKYLAATILLLALANRQEYTPPAKYLYSHLVHLSPFWDRLLLNEAVAFGHIFHDTGHYDYALKMREKVVEDLNTETGPFKIIPEECALRMRGELAIAYRRLSRFSEAEEIQRELLKARRDGLGEHHPSTIIALGNLSITYALQGRLNEAEAWQTEAMKAAKVLGGEISVDTMAALAYTYFELGKFNDAAILWEEVLPLDKEMRGELHLDTISTATSLVLAYRELGRLGEAEAIQTEVLRMRKEAQGENHPKTVTAMLSMAEIYQERCKEPEARDLCSEAESIISKTLGSTHPQYEKCQRIKRQLQGPRDTVVPVARPLSGTSNPRDHSSPAGTNIPHTATTTDTVDRESPQSTRVRDNVRRLLSRLRISSA